MPRINVFLNDDLYNDLQAVKSNLNLNISKICQQALTRAIDNPEECMIEIDTTKNRHTPILRIPSYLLQGLGDQGLTQTLSNGVVEDDDLRITVNLISGQHILIPSTSRLIIEESGDLVVEILNNHLGA